MIRSSSAGTSGFKPHGSNRCPIQDGLENDSCAFTPERQYTRRHLVEHCPEREKVGTGVQFLSAHLLRRHISTIVPTAAPGLVR